MRLRKLLVALAVMAVGAGVAAGCATTPETRESVQTATTQAPTSALYPVELGDKWGFIDKTGAMVIQPQYAGIDAFCDGLAAVCIDVQSWGYIDVTGTMVIEPQYDIADPFSEGLAYVHGGRLSGYIDTTGALVIPTRPAVMRSPFSDGLALVCAEDGMTFDYIDKTGNVVVSLSSTEYEVGLPFSEGLACVVTIEGRYGLIDKSGKMVVQLQYGCSPFCEGLAVAGDDKCGFIDKTGKMVIEPEYDMAYPFSEGLAPVALARQDENTRGWNYDWGFIDKSGNLVIPAQYEAAMLFREGLAPVMVDGKWGFIDKTGAMVIQPQYEYPPWGRLTNGWFHGGLCPVMVDGKWGFIDTTGTMVVPAQYDAAQRPFKWDFARGIGMLMW